jgi:hypothetical protein
MKYFWLVILSIGLSLLAILFLDKDKRSQENFIKEEQVTYLLGEKAASLSKLSITHDARQIHIAKINDIWFYESSESGRTQLSEKLSKQISMLRIAKIEREFLVASETLSDYGLSSGSSKILLTFQDGDEKLEFLIGAIAPDSFGQYLYQEKRKRIIIIPTFQAENILSIGIPTTQ